jgi:Flp pilus assembly protein TadG
MRSSPDRSRSRERGATAVFVAITLALLGAFLALAINAGHLFTVRHDLQNAADSGALAGAIELDGTTTGLSPAQDDAAPRYAGYYTTTGNEQVEASPVELGHWTPPSETCASGEAATGNTGPNGYRFCRVLTRDTPAALRINAVRVQTSRAAGAPGGGGAPVFANGLLGAASTADVRTEAVAVAGGPCGSACGNIPFVLQEGCAAAACLGSGPHFYFVDLANNNLDTAGFTNLLPVRSVSTGSVCEILDNPQYCEENRPNDELSQGDTISTANGAQWGAQCSAGSICETLRGRVNTSANTARIPIVLYPGEDAAACDANYNGFAAVQGFATIKIVLVQCARHGATPAVDRDLTSAQAQSMIQTCYPGGGGGNQPQVCMVLQLMCDQLDDGGGGCGWYGTTGRPRLVR